MRFLSLFWLAFALSGADYDLLIRNARVVDGTGNPWYRGDIGIRNGRIAAVGELSHASAARTVDAKERVPRRVSSMSTRTSRAVWKQCPVETTTSWMA